MKRNQLVWNSLVVLAGLWLVGCGKTVSELPIGGEKPKPATPAAPPHRPSYGEVGNGGHGVMINGHVYLVDLVESGIHDNPYIDWNGIEDESRVMRQVEKKVGTLPNFPTKELSRKFENLLRMNAGFGWGLINAFEMYEWRFVNHDLALLPLPGNIISLNEGDVRLIANRRGKTIYLNRTAFDKMDPINQVATIIHELVYATIKPQAVNSKGDDQFVQNAVHVREVVGNLFTMSTVEKIREQGFEAMAGAEGLFYSPHRDGLQNGTMLNALDYIPSGKKRERVIVNNYELKLSAGDYKEDLWSVDPVRFCRSYKDMRLPTATLSITTKEENESFKVSFSSYKEGSELKDYVSFVPVKAKVAKFDTYNFDDEDIRKCETKVTTKIWEIKFMLEPQRRYFESDSNKPEFKEARKNTRYFY